ncbi:hypothetical protein HYH03_005708 [Edaphochlamys debaryana]|uniref:Serine-threonine/tyrosine-protein kinase catalytic domain-containing protein n=1 Tax=Edaphochlamys debaryana TaxID=47281 RepID=A0A836C0V3_9CHLO|nr:hypothetical protein HYH03_005708 [Edaphochlamys debaryana]|eukprot:KAG2496105.1 hypothetical protein HYH03_005708 [Edaphochlamys debaryana]
MADDVDAKDQRGRTALHDAAERDAADAAALLLAGGASPLACDDAGRTPLHLACLHSRDGALLLMLASVTRLCSSSGDCDSDEETEGSEGTGGEEPSEGSAEGTAGGEEGPTPGGERSGPASSSQASSESSSEQGTEDASLLYDSSGWTPAHLAAAANNVEAIRALGEAGFEVETVWSHEPAPFQFWTPVHCAVAAGAVEVAELLYRELQIHVDFGDAGELSYDGTTVDLMLRDLPYWQDKWRRLSGLPSCPPGRESAMRDAFRPLPDERWANHVFKPEALEIGEPLGQGSFGAVHAGTYRGEPQVAVKCALASDDGSVRRDLQAEADMLLSLPHHDSIASLVGAGKDASGTTFLVMRRYPKTALDTMEADVRERRKARHVAVKAAREAGLDEDGHRERAAALEAEALQALAADSKILTPAIRFQIACEILELRKALMAVPDSCPRYLVDSVPSAGLAGPIRDLLLRCLAKEPKERPTQRSVLDDLRELPQADRVLPKPEG